MASACVNNNISVSPESFPSYGWLSPGRSSRMSFSRDEEQPSSSSKKPSLMAEDEEDIQDPVDFEFRLEDPVTMLPADELFSDGKLVPLHLSALKPSLATTRSTDESTKPCMDPYLFSPKAPRCSSRWKELLGLKKLYQNSKSENHSKTTPSNPPPKSSIKHFLHRNSKSSSSSSSGSSSLESSLSLPLLKDLSDSETVSLSSSRLSLSSSSSGHEHEDLPRLSLDSDKPGLSPSPNPFANPPRMRIVKHRDNHNQPHNTNTTHVSRAGRSPMRRETAAATSRGVSVDSPRLNSSGKIVFQSLERSSSSPSSFNGGPRFKHRGMERSYSANVRITPVLNVPVCSLRGSSKSGSVFGFGQLFSSQQKSGNGNGNGNGVRQQNNSRSRTDRT
ncbi:putative protein TPRXL [Pistacia vera]|uniref:putative protein TPRXL n=1 Tax=Pistacia vera TaxID=55513 RepID=UPI001262D0FE|nr:putative protein TPRXL [Pistacia vera]